MITVKQIAAMPPNSWKSDSAARGAGTLTFYASRSGDVSGYFRYTDSTGRTDRLALGAFDDTGRAGYTLAELRERAGVLSRLYLSGVKDLRHHFEEQERQAQAAEEAARRAKEEQEAATKAEALAKQRFTLRRLCEVYASHLEARGKTQSAKHARSMFKVHVFEAAPDLADTPAREVTRRDITGLVRRVNEKGHVRAGGILRAYLSAAYALAVNAEGDSQAPSELLGFDLDTNPVSGVKAIPVQTSERVLSKDEVRAYLSRLWGDDLTSRFLVLHLLTAGQRVSQLLRVRVADYDASDGCLRLQDPKGRRQVAREHVLPLGPLASELVEVLIDRAKDETAKLAKRTGMEADPNPCIWCSSGGSVMSISTPGKRIGEIASDMKGIAFDARDVRRSVETHLAKMGISKDLRGQLLSHGLSGVQDQRYDRHRYVEEKRSALERWEDDLAAMLEEEKIATNVVQLRRRRRA